MALVVKRSRGAEAAPARDALALVDAPVAACAPAAGGAGRCDRDCGRGRPEAAERAEACVLAHSQFTRLEAGTAAQVAAAGAGADGEYSNAPPTVAPTSSAASAAWGGGMAGSQQR